ncbi:MAG: hypothetical protein KA335_00010 [Ramlibacter sp.]|jgi:hypothetical protein|nr:hypothetical protein [Ramlibacter sp.]
MVEPARKGRLSGSENAVSLIPKVAKRRALIFVTNHPTRPGRLDLSTFRDGNPRPMGNQWLGPYKGRPKLTAELAPAIEQLYSNAPKRTVDRISHALRVFWRLFDRHEGLAPVRCVADITDLHGALQLREGFDRAATSTFLNIINVARKEAGLPWLAWPVNEDARGNADLPARRHVALIYQYLKRHAYKAIDRIELALASGGSAAPDRKELFHLLLLFVLRTGWNRSTAMDLDLKTCITAHPTSSDHHVVRAVKTRGNTEQAAIGLNKSSLSPGNIVRLLGRATDGLRAQVQCAIELHEKQGLKGDPDTWRLDMANLQRLLRSPWLCQVNSNLGVATISPSCSLVEVIREMNGQAPPERQVPQSITVGDLRDAYIGFAYEYSGYSWMVAKIAAGHKSLGALKAYLRQRQWKAHSEKKVLRFGESMWKLIEQRRIVDPAILHAMVERGQVSQEQVERWLAHKDRTRVGTGCSNFRNPPRRLAPEHVEGSGCRIQRCTLCEHAIVFTDSADGLCRRMAELQAIQLNMALTAWLESSFPDEVEMTQSALNQFDPNLIAERLSYWTAQIAAGTHRPVDMEGSYAPA